MMNFNVQIIFCFRVLQDPTVFLSFVGADQLVTEQSKDTETAGLNRGRVCSLVVDG